MKETLDDFTLLRKFIDENLDEYFDELYDRYSNLTYQKAFHYAQNFQDAEDITQNIWVKVYFSLSKFQFKSSFKTWLYRVSVNESINYLKSKDKKAFLVEDITVFPDINEIELEENKIDVTFLLKQLSKLDRALLLMKYVDGYSYEEMSEYTGFGVSALKIRIKRLKEKLKDYELKTSINPTK